MYMGEGAVCPGLCGHPGMMYFKGWQEARGILVWRKGLSTVDRKHIRCTPFPSFQIRKDHARWISMLWVGMEQKTRLTIYFSLGCGDVCEV